MALKWCEEALSQLEKEPGEDEVLIRAIKTYTKEKKANNALGYDSDDEFFDDVNPDDNDGMTSERMNRTRTSGFRETLSMFKKKRENAGDGGGTSQNKENGGGTVTLFRTASNSFYKTTSRSTAISSKESKRSIFYG